MKLDEFNDSDVSEDEEQYSNLAEAVSQLDNTRRVKAPTRKELSTVISEFHLPKEKSKKGDVVNVNELTEVLRDKSASHVGIRDKVKSVIKKGKTLPKPLETPVAERIKRAVAYENVQGQLRKWNAIVERNRVADNLSFPLKQSRLTLESSSQFLGKFKPATPLEMEMAKVLGTKTQETDDEDELNDKLEFPLTLEEMMEKKKELATIRAKLSYQEAKAYRQSKIKSKKYHRILKREKVKQQLKEFEQLQKTDPEAALKKLEELDKSRAEERASLRHKSTGKWARNMAVRAKYNTESRKILAEQLKLSRDLSAKVKNVVSDEELSDNENPTEGPRDIFTTSDNPWALKTSSEVSDFVSTCKKYWEDKNKEKQNKASAVEGKTSSEVPQRENTTNGSEPCSNDSNVNAKSLATKEPQKDIVDLVSSRNNKLDDKGGKSVKSETRTSISVQCKKSKESVDVVSNGKSKKSRKKDVDDSNAVGKQELLKTNSKENLKKNKTISGKKVKSKRSERKEKKSKTKIHSTSGLWTVHEVNEEKERNHGKRKNLNDIDELFEDLDDKLTSKTTKKLNKIREKYNDKKKRKNTEEKQESDSNDEDDLAFKNPMSLRPDVDEDMAETIGEIPEAANGEIPAQTTAFNFEISDGKEAPPEIDPKKFIEVKTKKLNTKLPDNLTGDADDYMDDEETATQQMNIVEAFGDDDVLEEFEEMKKTEEENTKPETPEALPGWGSWGGTGVKPDDRKIKRNMIDVPKLPPRKDKNKKDIIIREKTNPNLLQHLVKDVPHPFKSVGAFESNLRHPLGREWIPETAHRKFIKKPVETLMGAIIEPMDESELLRLQKEEKSLYRGKKKQKK